MPTRGYSPSRQCPVNGPGIDQCPRVVRPGYLMCGAHWRDVPVELQRDVWRWWRQWNRTHSDEAWENYSAARASALAAVQTQEDTRRGRS